MPKVAVNFQFSNGPSPTFVLSFPRIIPPDAEIVKSIRIGDVNRVKELITAGNTSSADMIYP